MTCVVCPLLVGAILTVAATASGQRSIGEGRRPIPEDLAVETIAKELVANLDGETAKESARAGKQLTAPASSSAGGSVVDAPSFVQVIGLALDRDLLDFTNGALTTDLNFFALTTLVDPTIVTTQESYARYSGLRRLGGSLTLGGKGEEFDQDGDGTKDKATESENLTDKVHAEIRWRFFGTRDRRDLKSVGTYVTAMKDFEDKLVALRPRLAILLRQAIEAHDTIAIEENRILTPCEIGHPDKGRCLFEDGLPALTTFVKSKLDTEFAELGTLLNGYGDAHANAIQAIDRQALWTAVVTTTQQSVEFGPRRLGVGLRGLFSTGTWDHTLNIDWGRADWRRGRPMAYSAKFGYSVSRLLSSDASADMAPKVTLAFNGERFRDVPDAKHDAIFTAGVRLDIPLNETVSVPISVNYASHTDLLTNQRLITGHVALAWDFSGLSRKKKTD